MTRQENDGGIGVELGEGLEQGHAIQSGHDQVRDDHRRSERGYPLEGVLAIDRRFPVRELLRLFQHDGVVIGNENPTLHVFPPSLR